jgi:hypothetical protein
MGPPSPDPTTADQLSASLCRVAASPSQSRHLYEILGSYCHECRNLLNSLKMSLYLAARGVEPEDAELWKELEPRYLLAEKFVERLQQLLRPAPLSLVKMPVTLLIHDRLPKWKADLAGQGRALALEIPEGLPAALYDPMRLGAALDDLVTWRALDGPRSADLRLRCSADSEAFHLHWDEPERPAAPDHTTAPDPPPRETEVLASLTLPLLTGLMTLHGGELVATRRPRWRLNMRWPLGAKCT